jgi:hypothetical protein
LNWFSRIGVDGISLIVSDLSKELVSLHGLPAFLQVPPLTTLLGASLHLNTIPGVTPMSGNSRSTNYMIKQRSREVTYITKKFEVSSK